LCFPSWPLVFRSLHLRAIDAFAGPYGVTEADCETLAQAVRMLSA
jgi:hypothetical protein